MPVCWCSSWPDRWAVASFMWMRMPTQTSWTRSPMRMATGTRGRTGGEGLTATMETSISTRTRKKSVTGWTTTAMARSTRTPPRMPPPGTWTTMGMVSAMPRTQGLLARCRAVLWTTARTATTGTRAPPIPKPTKTVTARCMPTIATTRIQPSTRVPRRSATASTTTATAPLTRKPPRMPPPGTPMRIPTATGMRPRSRSPAMRLRGL